MHFKEFTLKDPRLVEKRLPSLRFNKFHQMFLLSWGSWDSWCSCGPSFANRKIVPCYWNRSRFKRFRSSGCLANSSTKKAQKVQPMPQAPPRRTGFSASQTVRHGLPQELWRKVPNFCHFSLKRTNLCQQEGESICTITDDNPLKDLAQTKFPAICQQSHLKKCKCKQVK